MSSPSAYSSAWGYLLPLTDALPSVELLWDKTQISADHRGNLCVGKSYSLSHLLPDAPPYFFEVRRFESDVSACVILYKQSETVSLNGQALQKDHETPLEHTACIAFGAEEATYVYVNRKDSEFFKAPPGVLEEYLVGHRLGKGTFGKVYIIFDKKLHYQRKAMKIVEPKNEKQVQFAEREAEILKSLRHPCVIETYSIKRLGMQQYLLMEYLAGGDLSQFVNDEHLLSEAQTKLIFFQLALAVRYLHGKHVCHRDLKPDNILLQRRDPHTLIKVTDFGLAKDVKNNSSLKTLAGTRPYLAPEIISKKNPYTPAVDVWSMGVILFYSLSGTLPFESLEEAIRSRYDVKYTRAWRDVSSSARSLVKNILKPKASQRLTVTGVIENSWLQDPAMREAAYQLTGLKK